MQENLTTEIRNFDELDSVKSEFSLEFDDLNKFVNLGCSSAKVEKITVNRFNGEPREIRPQINLFLSARYGEFKSSIMRSAQKCYGGVYRWDMSYAGLVGSVDKNTGELVDSLAWEARGKTLFVDEFHKDRYGYLWNAFRALLEGDEYARSISMKKISQPPNKWKDCYYKIQKGSICIKSRFATIMASMYPLKIWTEDVSTTAVLDRCIPVRYHVTPEQMYQIMEGKQIFRYEPYSPEPEIIISASAHNEILHFWKANTPKEQKLDPRAFDNLLRTFAVIGNHDYDLYRLSMNCEMELNRQRNKWLQSKQEQERQAILLAEKLKQIPNETRISENRPNRGV